MSATAPLPFLRVARLAKSSVRSRPISAGVPCARARHLMRPSKGAVPRGFSGTLWNGEGIPPVAETSFV